MNNNVLEYPKHTFTSYSSGSKLSCSTKYKLFDLLHDTVDKPSACRAMHIYMVDGMCQDWKRNTRMIILKWVNNGMKINNLKLNNYDCLAFLPGQRFDPINVNTWPQAMICLYLKPVVFAMTTGKARASPWPRKYKIQKIQNP